MSFATCLNGSHKKWKTKTKKTHQKLSKMTKKREKFENISETYTLYYIKLKKIDDDDVEKKDSTKKIVFVDLIRRLWTKC